jgi:hypothetical protein
MLLLVFLLLLLGVLLLLISLLLLVSPLMLTGVPSIFRIQAVDTVGKFATGINDNFGQ